MDFAALSGFKKIAILSSVMLIIFIAFYFALWRPGLAELKKYQVDLNSKATELIQLERDAKDWPDTITREMITRYENRLEMLWDLIPTEEGLSLLIDEVQNHAIVSGLQIIALNRDNKPKKKQTVPGQATPVTESRYKKATYKIQVRGGYSGITRFIRSLEESDRLITINKIDSKSNPDTDPLKWGYAIDAEIDFNIYYSKVGVERV